MLNTFFAYLYNSTFKLILLMFLVGVAFSCQSELKKESNQDVLSRNDQKKDVNFYYNEKELTWERIASAQNTRDSLVKNVFDLNNQGTNLRNNAQFKDALKIHFQALQLAQEINDTIGKILAFNNIGTDLRRTSSNTEASEYHYRALELANSHEKYTKNSAIAMNGLGNIFLTLNKLPEAQSYFEKSLAIETKLESNLGQAINYANLGEVLKKKGDYIGAIQYYGASLNQNEILQSDVGIAICKNAIGRILLEQGNAEQALKLMQESVQILKGTNDSFHELEMQISLCETLININRIEEAQVLLNKIHITAKEIHSSEHQQISHDLQSNLSSKKNDYKTALKSKELAIVFRDSTIKQNNEVRILELENRYKNKEAFQQIKLLIAENKLFEKDKTNQQRLFLMLFLLMLTTIGFIYYRYLNRRKINKELKKVNEMKSRFYGNVSHEFRTPLTLIKGPLEKILSSPLPQYLKSDAEIMHRNTQRLQYLVDQILSLSKIDVGKFQVSAQKANLSHEIKGIAQSFEYQSIDKKLNYKVEIEESDLVWFDAEIIEIILTNLLSNAFKFTPENGNITFKTKKEEKTYSICLSNTNDSLTEKDLTKIFDRFYSSASSHFTGTGIGLSLVKELCALYSAKLTVQSNSDNEIEFTIVIPTHKSHFAEDEIQLNKDYSFHQNTFEENVQSFSQNGNSDKKTQKTLMLIVEDNDDMRKYVTSIFENDYDILEAANGKEGIESAKKHIPDIIVSDVMMPIMDGMELCNVLKKDVATNHIPIILLTALTEEENVLVGLENNADDFISKPFTIKILKSKVKNLIQIRKTLSERYREEIIIKPSNLLLKTNTNLFNDIIKVVLEKHISNPDFNVEKFCEIAGMSRTQLHRKTTATTGMSVTEFIRVHRVKVAAELLKSKDINISDACYASGFNNTSYFSKQFKIVYGITPLEYRKQNHRHLSN